MAQQLYMPRDVKIAYRRNERSPDGKPGKKYWQNKARYTINVTVNPAQRKLNGDEEIIFINGCPDSLRYLNFRLIQNIHKPGAARHRDVEEEYLTSGLHIDSFAINNLPQVWVEPKDAPTRKWIDLAKPIPGHDSMSIYFKWHYDISRKARREGMIDSTTAFLAYFYPRIGVIDDYNWMDLMDFTEDKEFYNDFNNYTLNVTVPKDYVVWATGTLQNMNEVLQPAYAKKLSNSFTSDSIINIADKNDYKNRRITATQNYNTWKWSADNISDVAFGVSDHFKWDASSIIVDDKTQKRVSVQALYNDTVVYFNNVVPKARDALKWFSNNWPGVTYPYPKTTISSGFENMEYPMMVNELPNNDFRDAYSILNHEIAHTWFPFYMGINESRYPFMDEGWASEFEYLISIRDNGYKTADSLFKQDRIQSWATDPTLIHDLPIITPADALSGAAIGDNAYGKAALAYGALKDLLGNQLFKKCLHEFMERWHGKHPIPWDFFNTFNAVSRKNLDWFWNNWFFSNGYMDVAIDTVYEKNNMLSIVIKNKGGFAIPLNVDLKYADGTNETIHYTPGIWHKNQQQFIARIQKNKKIKTVTLDTGVFVDADEKNNKWTKK